MYKISCSQLTISVSFSIGKITLPPLSHVTFCTPTKSNLYLANFLASAVSELALYWILTFHVPNLISLFRCLGHTKVSIQVLGKCSWFATKLFFTVRNCQHVAQPPSYRTTPCRLSATAYSIYSQLPSILDAVPTSATWGSAMPWWQVPTYQGFIIKCLHTSNVLNEHYGISSNSYHCHSMQWFSTLFSSHSIT